MAVPAGYVSYTFIEQVMLTTCVNTYANPRHSPSMANVMTEAARSVTQRQPGFANGFSFFEFSVLLNNLNGARPLPAGNVIVAKVSSSWTRIQPCGTPRPPTKRDYFEKFSIPPPALGQPPLNGLGGALDIQFFVTGCDSEICFERTVEYAILADPAPGTAIPNNEYAVTINLNAQQQQAFANAVTLRFNFSWRYDNCNNPRNTPCRRTHCFEFTSRTLDPDKGGQVTSTLPGSPIKFEAD
jgi:hypothetical protein